MAMFIERLQLRFSWKKREVGFLRKVDFLESPHRNFHISSCV